MSNYLDSLDRPALRTYQVGYMEQTLKSVLRGLEIALSEMETEDAGYFMVDSEIKHIKSTLEEMTRIELRYQRKLADG